MTARSSASDPYLLALRILTRRGHSEAELAAKLRAKGCPSTGIDLALQRCRELGYLDDGRFARERAGALLRSGRAAGRRLLGDLRRRGIAAELAGLALAEAAAECDAAAVLRTLRQRRYPDFDFAAATPQEKRRVTDFFLRRGFPLSLVLSILSEER